ncbi:uncharacterized protein [Prorops nasuta]|uniref:uncharacterized protein n=1 Tax=Prorops nasuta TaxID=863751 RepID=UPI0034CF423B
MRKNYFFVLGLVDLVCAQYIHVTRILRNRTIAQQLVEDDNPSDVDDNLSEFEDGSDLDYGSNYSSDEQVEENDLESELENVVLSSIVLEARERRESAGRPNSIACGKNGYVWRLKKPQRVSDRLNPGVAPVIVSGPINNAANATTIEEFWEILFSPDIIEDIVKFTNIQIEFSIVNFIAKESIEQSYHHPTYVAEIRAYIAVTYYSGLWKQPKVRDFDLWSVENGTSFYRCVFPLRRWNFLTENLRFDDRATRDSADKFAPVRGIFEKFINNCKNNYKPSTYCTVDEQLLGFRDRCAFRTYIKNKPDKCGLLLITLNDARTAYLINAIPRLGIGTVRIERDELVPQVLLRQVTEPIHGSNRSVTCDNLYTAIPLFEQMKEEPYKLTMTRTIRKNKREIPMEMKVARKELPSTKFCFSNSGITLLSFTPKKNKVVLLASSFMNSEEIIDGKSKIVLHYNNTKGGTDTFDALCKNYTVVRRSNRWPLRIFWAMLDQAMVNARILLKCKNSITGDETKVPAIICMKKIIWHLVKPWITVRQKIPNLRISLKIAIETMLKMHHETFRNNQDAGLLAKRTRCRICPTKFDKKTCYQCISCLRPMCLDHRSKLCSTCACVE